MTKSPSDTVELAEHRRRRIDRKLSIYMNLENHKQHQQEELANHRDEPTIRSATPAESIGNTMTKSPSDTVELAELAEHRRRGTLRNEKDDSLRSMDLFLRSEDLELASGRLQSSDFVKDLLKSEASIAADEPDTERRILSLAAKLDRISTADRVTSGEWVGDFKAEAVNLGPMDPSLFMNTLSPSPLASATWYQEYQMPLSSGTDPYPMPPLPDPDVMDGLHRAPLTDSIINTVTPGGSTTSKRTKKKRRKPRVLDESRVVDPTDDDVLFGRGGFTNSHPGNMRFRQKALELRPWYEQSTKDEKQRIADVLVESITSEGGRFVEKGKDGLWHEVNSVGVHRKASQQLRERLKGQRKRARN